jgi:hypothetical protein
MWYHPGAFALDWRDVVAAWIICFAVAAALFGCGVFDSEGEAEARSAATRPVIGLQPGGTLVTGHHAAPRSG